jgi:protein SCO1/2
MFLLLANSGALAGVPDRTDPIPRRAQAIDVTERLGQSVGLNEVFVDQAGRTRNFGEFFDGRRPTLLTMNYSNCPMLCSLHLNGVATALKDMKSELGVDYRIVTVSFDPQDTSDRLAKMRSRFLHDYGRPVADESAWTFLHGTESSIHAVARAVGISYAYNEERKEYLHPAVAIVLSPQGKITRYLYGLELVPKTVHLSLVEASAGKVGTTLDRLILYCFHYDSSEGRYAPAAMNIMRVAGLVAALAVGSLLSRFWLAELRRRKRAVEVHS